MCRGAAEDLLPDSSPSQYASTSKIKFETFLFSFFQSKLIREGRGKGKRAASPVVGEEMITRSKLVEQLREYQIRSQHKWVALTSFSPNPHIATRRDVIVALVYTLLFSFLTMSCCVSLYFKHFRVSSFSLFLGMLLLMCLKLSRHRKLTKKRERRLLLPLSM